VKISRAGGEVSFPKSELQGSNMLRVSEEGPWSSKKPSWVTTRAMGNRNRIREGDQTEYKFFQSDKHPIEELKM